MQDPKTIVQEFYAAFARGDIESILKGLHPNVAWEVWTVDNHAQKARVPWLQPHNSRDSVREFFTLLGGFTWIDFRVLSLMSGGNQVAAEVQAEWEGTQRISRQGRGNAPVDLERPRSSGALSPLPRYRETYCGCESQLGLHGGRLFPPFPAPHVRKTAILENDGRRETVRSEVIGPFVDGDGV